MVFKCLLNCVIFLILVTPAMAKSSATIVKEGNANYTQGQYQEAINAYNNALSVGGQENVARYNLGNALFRKSQAQAKTNIDGAIADMEQSIANYKQVTDKALKDKDAKFNLDVAKKALEKLKQQKKQQEQQKQNSKDQKDNKDKKDQNDQKNDKNDKQDNSKQDKSDQGQKNDQSQKSEQGKDQQQDSQDNQDEQKKQEDQQKKEQGKQDQSKQDPSKNNEKDQAQQQGQMSKEEAKNILEDYQRNEEPQGLLNFIEKNKGDEQPVSKDW